MRCRIATLVCLLVLIGIVDLNAQSLISKLPRDGTWATYAFVGETKQPDGEAYEFEGEITIRCVGSKYEEMESLRWIEIEQQIDFRGEEIKIIDKFLLPEDEIGFDKDAVSKIRKMWRYHSQFGEDSPRKVETNSTEMKTLESFLPPPFKSRKELANREFKTSLGVLKCRGSSSKRKEKDDRSGVEYDRKFIVYSNDESPFGTVSWRNEVTTKRAGEDTGIMIGTLTLKEIGTNAKSSLPDNH